MWEIESCNSDSDDVMTRNKSWSLEIDQIEKWRRYNISTTFVYTHDLRSVTNDLNDSDRSRSIYYKSLTASDRRHELNRDTEQKSTNLSALY